MQGWREPIRGSKLVALFKVVLISLTLSVWTALLLAAYIVYQPDAAAKHFPSEISRISGERMLLRFKAKYKFCTDRILLGTVHDLLHSVVPASTPFSYSVLIPSSGAIAQTLLSLPGGFILVGAEFISRTSSPAAVAAVIAHEIGHVELRHAERYYLRRLGYREALLRLSDFLPAYDNAALAAAERIVEYLVFKQRDLDEEFEADLYGNDLLQRSGYPAGELSRALKPLIERAPENLREKELSRLRKLEDREQEPEQTPSSADVMQISIPVLENWNDLKTRCDND